MALDNNPVTAVEMGLGPDERDDQPKKTPEQIAQYYLDAVLSAEKRRKPYVTRGKQIVKRYKNKRTLTTLGVPLAQRKMNVLWSNVQTQMPVLFAQMPKANVSRRNHSKDQIGRVSSIVLQNALQNSIGMEDFVYIMSRVVLDRLLPGAGLAMVEYVPQIAEGQVGWQAAETRYVNWMDWVTNPARTHDEVWLFAYKVYLTRGQAADVAYQGALDEGKSEQEARAFRSEVWQDLTCDHREDDKEPNQTGKAGITEIGPAKATVWVCWDKMEKQVIQVSPGYSKAPLAVRPPPVAFDGFFPCPRPLQSSTTNDSTNPVPDFEQYVDQADEIDMLTQRISVLAQALRLRGLYPADMDSLKQLTEAGDADMIPYDQWQLIMERGGANALVLWFPIEAVAKTLEYCLNARDRAIQIMYQVTGIGDIQRGATDPNETAAAQQLKAQFGSIRTKDGQREVQRFIRDLLRLKAEVICEHFQLESIKVMSGMNLLEEKQKQQVQMALQIYAQFEDASKQYQAAAQQAQAAAQQGGAPQPMPPPPQQPPFPKPTEEMEEALEEPSWEQIMQVLRNDKLRGFVVDVETDSTIEPDQQAQQQAAVQFTSATAQFLTAALPIMQAEPEAVDFLGELMSWTASQWKSADTIEGAVNEFIDKMRKKVEAAKDQPPPPHPEVVKAQAQAETEKARAQADVAVEQSKAQVKLAENNQRAELEARKHAEEMQLKQIEVAGKIQVEREKMAAEAAQKEKEREHQLHLETLKLMHATSQSETDRQFQGQQAQEDRRAKRMEARAGTAEDVGQEVVDMGAGDKLIAALDKQAQVMERQSEAMAKLAENVSKPRKLVRGPDGRPAGSVVG